MNKYQKKEQERRKRKIKCLIKRWITLSILLILLITILIILINKNRNKQDNENSNVKQNQNKQNIEISETIETSSPEIDSKVTDWELILVNKDNKLSEDYKFELEEVEYIHKVDTRIADSLREMLSDARKEGLNPLVVSSYRTHSIQQTLYNNKIKEFKEIGYSQSIAEEKASYWVAIPGTSEHEAGLALDIVAKDYQKLDEEQENTPVQKWLMENCYKYGFILRYPTEKKDITKINYEPWHYRYVGVENATFMKEKGFCLEEYVDYLKSFYNIV